MKTIRLPLAVFLSLCFLLLVQALYYYPQMPDQVASHFNLAGKADAWRPKGEFLAFELVIVGLLTGLFLAVSLLLPKLPTDLINIPHKSYWLAEERRAATFAYLSRTFLWLGCIAMLSLATLFQFVYHVNLSARTELPASFYYFLGAYLLCTLSFVIKLLIHFSKPRTPSP